LSTLPTSHADKLAYLQAAARHGAAIGDAARPGAPAAPLRAYAAGMPALTLSEPMPGQLVLRYGDLVRWDVNLDPAGVVLGYGFSGYGDLMAALGIDFAGQPYCAG
jgi:hypothetical protein